MTRVIFRINKSGQFKNTVNAIFVDQLGTNNHSTRTCYAHVGQHGICSLDWARIDTKPATKEQYQELLNELVNYCKYDDLVVLKRIPIKMKVA